MLALYATSLTSKLTNMLQAAAEVYTRGCSECSCNKLPTIRNVNCFRRFYTISARALSCGDLIVPQTRRQIGCRQWPKSDWNSGDAGADPEGMVEARGGLGKRYLFSPGKIEFFTRHGVFWGILSDICFVSSFEKNVELSFTHELVI